MILTVICVLGIAAGLGLIARYVWTQRPRKTSYEDPYDDPAVQDMIRQVIRTGRPMHMVRGEPPQYIDGRDTPRVKD